MNRHLISQYKQSGAYLWCRQAHKSVILNPKAKCMLSLDKITSKKSFIDTRNFSFTLQSSFIDLLLLAHHYKTSLIFELILFLPDVRMTYIW